MNAYGQRPPAEKEAGAFSLPERLRTPGEPSDVLPPVRPPAASFIVQLFLIPLLIVGCIVGVWFAFSWLAHVGSRPAELAKDLDRMDHYGWQRALTLANMLRDAEDGSLRRDERLAQQVAGVLQREIKRGGMDDDSINLRIYLCRALGEFERTEGLDALLVAAERERDPAELVVRSAALQAIAVLCERVPPDQVLRAERLLPVLEQAARDRSEVPEQDEPRAHIRQSAAFVLGLLPDPRAVELLVSQGSDRHFIVRANAHVGLARHGDARAIPALIEMLNPTVVSFSELDQGEQEIAMTRSLVYRNALRAIQVLVRKNPHVDIHSLQAAIQQLVDSKPDPAVTQLAKETLTFITRAHPETEREETHARN